jgi:hypothetical protein
MATPKRIQISIETYQVFVIRRRQSIRVWCQECARETEMLDLGELPALTGIPHQILHDAAETHGWHVLQVHDGSTLICLEATRWPRW